jgi:hypothetical protein
MFHKSITSCDDHRLDIAYSRGMSDDELREFLEGLESSREKRGMSVTRRIKSLGPERKVYIDPTSMDEIPLEDGIKMGPENLQPNIVGLAVDYLTRYRLERNVDKAFSISLLGGERSGRMEELRGYLSGITGIDDASVTNACKACLFDEYYRAGRPPSQEPEEICPDHRTCENIRVMVERSMKFFRRFGPVISSGPTFEGGYTDTVSTGDGDYLTEFTICKVSWKPPTDEQTLQLAMYYLMGKRSNWAWFDNIKNIGIFNPRLNKAYMLNIGSISPSTLKEIERDVIGYTD